MQSTIKSFLNIGGLMCVLLLSSCVHKTQGHLYSALGSRKEEVQDNGHELRSDKADILYGTYGAIQPHGKNYPEDVITQIVPLDTTISEPEQIVAINVKVDSIIQSQKWITDTSPKSMCNVQYLATNEAFQSLKNARECDWFKNGISDTLSVSATVEYFNIQGTFLDTTTKSYVESIKTALGIINVQIGPNTTYHTFGGFAKDYVDYQIYKTGPQALSNIRQIWNNQDSVHAFLKKKIIYKWANISGENGSDTINACPVPVQAIAGLNNTKNMIVLDDDVRMHTLTDMAIPQMRDVEKYLQKVYEIQQSVRTLTRSGNTIENSNCQCPAEITFYVAPSSLDTAAVVLGSLNYDPFNLDEQYTTRFIQNKSQLEFDINAYRVNNPNHFIWWSVDLEQIGYYGEKKGYRVYTSPKMQQN